MATASIREFGKAWWSEILNRVIGAVVFIDDASAECLHYEGGADTLLSAGAVAVKGLSPFEVRGLSLHCAILLPLIYLFSSLDL